MGEARQDWVDRQKSTCTGWLQSWLGSLLSKVLKGPLTAQDTWVGPPSTLTCT
jgi:hypothetical protein